MSAVSPRRGSRAVVPAQATPAAAAAARPGVAQVRLVGPPGVVDAAVAALAAQHGDLWQVSTRKPSRHNPADVVQYGTLIVPVAGGAR